MMSLYKDNNSIIKYLSKLLKTENDTHNIPNEDLRVILNQFVELETENIQLKNFLIDSKSLTEYRVWIKNRNIK